MSRFLRLPDLASDRIGGAAVYANDEFFAPKENLTKPAPPEWREHEYTDRGKWMDGWETRRRRRPGNDRAVVRLGAPGFVHGVVIDTRHFRGNHPESASIEAVLLEAEPGADGWDALEWTTIVPRTALEGDAENVLAADPSPAWSHVRLSIHPDGGVARLRVHGLARPPATDRSVDLAGILHGGSIVACSDAFFGQPSNLLLPGRSEGMWDGWETRRRRGPGHDWAVVRLGRRGRIGRVEIDTHHFKGNYPDRARVELADRPDLAFDEAPEESEWEEVVSETPLEADAAHDHEIDPPRAATHARLSIHPDGGVARLRLIGEAGP